MNFDHIGQMISANIETYADNPAFQYNDAGEWRTKSYREFGELIEKTAAALVRAGVATGDRVAIFSANRYEWAICDLACIMSGAVSVPIYATNTKEQASFIMDNASIDLIFVGDQEQGEKALFIKEQRSKLQIISYDASSNGNGVTSFNDFIAATPEAAELEELSARSGKINRDDMTTIIYTSGTTGNPKGVMLTHANLIHQFECVDANFSVSNKDTSLCFLPLSHVYERMWSYYVYLKGAVHTYLSDPKLVIDTMQVIKPTAMVSVPRLYEKIYSTIMNRQESASPLKKKLFSKAIEVGGEYNNLFFRDEPISGGLKLKYKFFDKLVLSKVRAVVGGDKNFFSAGGAPLEKSIEEFFLACGLLICQGYGLTETAPMVSYNTPASFKFGSVGKIVPGCEVKIADTGEIMVKGPQVMKGYFNNPQATAEAIEEGWFHTGDIGEFDEDGYLKITDRIKDLIITSGGKNIAPQNIETLVGKDFFIEQIIAIGDRRKFISALVVPAFEALEEWAKKKKIKYSSMEDLTDHPKVIDFYKKRIELQSKLLAQYETIKKFKLLPKPFTMEAGEITPTLKLKRKMINEKFKSIIDGMYHRNTGEEKKD